MLVNRVLFVCLFQAKLILCSIGKCLLFLQFLVLCIVVGHRDKWSHVVMHANLSIVYIPCTISLLQKW